MPVIFVICAQPLCKPSLTNHFALFASLRIILVLLCSTIISSVLVSLNKTWYQPIGQRNYTDRWWRSTIIGAFLSFVFELLRFTIFSGTSELHKNLPDRGRKQTQNTSFPRGVAENWFCFCDQLAPESARLSCFAGDSAIVTAGFSEWLQVGVGAFLSQLSLQFMT